MRKLEDRAVIILETKSAISTYFFSKVGLGYQELQLSYFCGSNRYRIVRINIFKYVQKCNFIRRECVDPLSRAGLQMAKYNIETRCTDSIQFLALYLGVLELTKISKPLFMHLKLVEKSFLGAGWPK